MCGLMQETQSLFSIMTDFTWKITQCAFMMHVDFVQPPCMLILSWGFNHFLLLPFHGIPRSLLFQKLKLSPIWRLQTPFQGLKVSSLLPPHRDERGLGLGLCAFDPEADVDIPMQGVQIAADPGHFAGKVDLVAEQLAGVLVGAQREEDRVHRRGRRLLVVEDGQARHRHQQREDRERFHPRARPADVGERAVRSPGEERAGPLAGRGHERPHDSIR